jgi:chromate reductase
MKKPAITVLGISGSLRQRSLNTALLQAAAELAPAGIRLEHFDLTPIPLFNADLLAEGEPQAVVDFKARITQAHALLIATPEYNHSIPGVLKNALDWASRPRSTSPLRGKPLAIIGAGGSSGTLHAQRHMHDIAVALGMQPMEAPRLLLERAWEKFDAQGRLSDEAARQRLAAVLEGLADWNTSLLTEIKPGTPAGVTLPA